ncbi:MAG: hypothetical protein MJZ23_09595 [Paludibacteraceae bacterium]|nr:hypothetical protein [Paludibacteraceae bacterium]
MLFDFKKIMAVASIAIPVLLSNACKKDSDSEPDEPKQVVQKSYHDVYVAVTLDTVRGGGYSKRSAGYYHDGRIISLYGKAENTSVYANCISVDGYDVYVAGQEAIDAVYWKNGEICYLPSGTCASGIVAKNGNVIICGYEATNYGDKACCWVNGKRYLLENGSRATGITADNSGNIFIVGYEYDFMSDKYFMRYWIGSTNGGFNRFSVSPSKASNSLQGSAICLDETHTSGNGYPYICLAGFEDSQNGSVVKQWCDRKETKLTALTSNNEAMGISACNGKLYVCGRDMGAAKYWVSSIARNGEGQDLKTMALTDGKSPWCASAISVVEDDAYVCGYDESQRGQTDATIWKNKETYAVISTDPNLRVYPYSICVVPRKVIEEKMPSDSTATE